MSVKRLMTGFVIFLCLVGVGTVVIALTQDAIGWGWWWVVPLSAGIIVTILGFRLLIQRAVERQEAEDRRLDALEAQHPESERPESEQPDSGHRD